MDGVFMKKYIKFATILLLCLVIIFCCSVIADRHELNNGIIRLHIVAQSDSVEDQAVKLQVRDAVMAYLEEDMPDIKDADVAKEYLQENLDAIKKVADEVLASNTKDYTAQISLQKEEFNIRHYDTFSLPGGVYESLRIRLGDGEGQNWWCVVFPNMCFPASGTGDVSAFWDTLNDTLERKDGYQFRFILLDWIGSLEKLFFTE